MKELLFRHLTHGFGPLYDQASEKLILGSFPSSSPANASWSLERLTEAWREALLGGDSEETSCIAPQ